MNMKLALLITAMGLVSANVIPEGAVSVPENPLIVKKEVSTLFGPLPSRKGSDSPTPLAVEYKSSWEQRHSEAYEDTKIGSTDKRHQQCTCAGTSSSCATSLSGFCQDSSTFNCKGGHWVR